MTKEKAKTKKPKKYYDSKEPEVFWYLNVKSEKLWGFRHRYYDALGERREVSRQGFATETIAIRELLAVKTDLINGNQIKVDNSNLTISEWVDIWYDENEKNWAISTRIKREEIIRDHIKPLVGKYKLMELDRSTYVKKYINALLKSNATSTVENLHNIFRIAINAAVENEIINRNRFTRITITNKEDEKELDNFLTAFELKRFLQYAKNNVSITNYTSMLLLAYTGLRRGEALGLKWKNIDFINKKLTVERTRDYFGSRKPKTKRSNRTIIISDVLIEQLKIYRKWCLEIMFSKGKRLSDDDFVLVASSNAEPICGDTLNRSFDRVFEDTGIKRITPHGMRHTHATILLTSEERIPVAVIAKRLGNTPQMINNVYGHVVKEIEIESVTSFDGAINL